MAEELTLIKIKIDTLKYLSFQCLSRSELSFRIGCDKSVLTKFLNKPKCGMQSHHLINLLNILYYDKRTDKDSL